MVSIEDAKIRIKNAKALLFDFDGTLVNLDKLNIESVRPLLEKEFGVSFTRDDFMNFVSGRGSKDGMREFLAQYEIFEYDIEKLQNLFNEKKRKLISKKMDKVIYLMPGIEKFLDSMQVEKKRMLICTSSRKEYVEKVLSHFGILSFFETIIDREMVVKGKPEPDIFIKGADFFGVPNTECIVFEDSLFGLQSAKAFGALTIGIRNKGWNDDFVESLADAVITDYTELL